MDLRNGGWIQIGLNKYRNGIEEELLMGDLENGG